MATETAPTPSAPSSAASSAKPISLQQLSQELGPMKAKEPTAPAPESKPVKQAFREESSTNNVVVGDDKGNREVEPTMPNFREAARKKLEEKTKEAQKPQEEKKEEPKADTKKPEPAKEEAAQKVETPKTEAEVPAEHKQVLPHDKPDTARRIKAILAERDEARAEAKRAKEEYEAAKKTPSTPPEELQKLKEEHQKAQDDLLRYRRLYDINNDTEFAAKYREPVKQAEQTISSILKDNYGFGETTLKLIEKEGGFAAFSASRATFPVVVQDPQDPAKTKTIHRSGADIARDWLANMNVADAESIKATIGRQQLLRSEEQAAIKREQENAKTYFEQQTAAQRKAQAEATEAQKRTAEEFNKWLGDVETKTDWLKDREVPANATPEQKKEIEEHNAFNAQLRDGLRKAPNSVAEYGQMKLEAAEAHHLRRVMGQKDAEIARLTEELKKSKAAHRTAPKAGSLLTQGGDKPKEEKLDDPADFKTALRRARDRIVGGSDE